MNRKSGRYAEVSLLVTFCLQPVLEKTGKRKGEIKTGGKNKIKSKQLKKIYPAFD